MQIASPFISVPRKKIRMYKRSQLRALHAMREQERQEKAKLAKLAQKKYDFEWQLALRKLQAEEDS